MKPFVAINKAVLLTCLAATAAVLWHTPIYSQIPPALDPTGRSGQPPVFQKEEPKPSPQPSLILPPVPLAPSDKPSRFPPTRAFIRKIQVEGSTVFSEADLNKLVAPYENRELSFEDLEAVRVALTLNYVNRGYINSGAIIPDQTVSDGVVVIRVIEGELNAIEVSGNRWFRDSYIKDRLLLGVNRPFDINLLQERMQLLLQDRRFERLNADLRPGLMLGESVLNVRVEESSPFRLTFEYNNFQAPTVGANQGLVTFEHQNVFGFGDTFIAQHGGSNGIYPQIDIRYTFPFTSRDTTLSLNYRKNDSVVIEEPFNPLDITNKSEIFGVTIRHPLYRSLNQELAVELTGERLENKTFLLDRPFSFSPGVVDGKSVVAAIRLAQEWIYRSETQVVAARSRFSFGVDAFGATIHSSSSLPDSHFFAWLGQFQWAKRLPWFGIETLWRTDVQVANDSLFPLEQIAVGGRYSVRGYRENTLVRDNASIHSLEVRIPLVSDNRWADYLQIAPFYDIAYSWNRTLPTPEPKTLYSAGVGFRWAMTLRVPLSIRPQFEIYWGNPLKKLKTPGGNLQDHGLHLRFAVELF